MQAYSWLFSCGPVPTFNIKLGPKETDLNSELPANNWYMYLYAGTGADDIGLIMNEFVPDSCT